MMRRHTLTPVAKGLMACCIAATLAACGSDSDDGNGNLPPVAIPVSAVALMGEATAVDVLANDVDPDGDALTLTAVELTSGIGEASIKDKLLWFESDEEGLARVSYTISDGRGGVAESYAEIEVKLSLQSYVGTETCLRCHQDKASYMLTGHNFKLSPVVDGQAPQFPYTNIDDTINFVHGVENSAGDPEGWEDVSYVIGGYLRTVMFMDKHGYIMSGESTRIVLPENGEEYGPEHAFAYAPGDGPDSHPYNCGRCHATGWRDFTSEAGDDRNPHHQDDMIGIAGTFEQAGVQCEACHGAGSDHAKAPTPDNITRIAKGRTAASLQGPTMAYGQPIACGECHSKDGERRYPSYVSPYNAEFGGDSLGGRVVEYSQGGRYAIDGLLGMNPDTGKAEGAKRLFHCSECHNPHQSTQNRDKPEHAGALTKACQDCHGEVKFADGIGAQHAGFASCNDCHMPGSAHMFKIDLSQPSDDAYHFSADGKFRQPWLRPVEACQRCHQEDYDDRAAMVDTIHR
ncbi:cadherin-like domain-containing protein [Marinobacter hydrocarbonoclasticus]|nr:cadherin-like domain-containing protein [Marinobacter nauticus]